jgi:hypothetical protein
MTTVVDPRTQKIALVKPCAVCRKPIYFGYTRAGKRCPYDVTEDGEPTEVSHFTTCPNIRQWR